MNSPQENSTMARCAVRLLALVVACAAPALAQAQNMIRAITSSQQGGADVVRIELDQPLAAVPAGFAVQSPPRVALDLPSTESALGRNVVDINQGNLRSVAVAQGGDRTRLVMNLRQAASYRAEVQGKALVIVLESAAAPAMAAAPAVAPAATAAAGNAPAKADGTVHFADSQNAQTLPLRDIDFRRGKDGAGRVVVDLPSSQVGVDIRQQGQNLIVEFLRSSASEGLR
ncbi:MAG: hypothetical protein RIQ53_2054, partial [Pseudomonadota bacterium]